MHGPRTSANQNDVIVVDLCWIVVVALCESCVFLQKHRHARLSLLSRSLTRLGARVLVKVWLQLKQTNKKKKKTFFRAVGGNWSGAFVWLKWVKYRYGAVEEDSGNMLSHALMFRLAVMVLSCALPSKAVKAAVSPGGPTGTYSLYPPTHVGFFDQVIDHFTYDSQATFAQKFLVYDKFYRNSSTSSSNNDTGSGPIFFFFGGEGGVEDFYNNSGALFEYAPEFGALIVFLEHRYYGTSTPVVAAAAAGDTERQQLRYLTIEQALADTAVFLSSKAAVLGCPADTDVILWGGSYGGMLAAWFRFKYAHLSTGAIAASAPITLTGLPQASDMQDVFYNATLSVYAKYGGDSRCASLVDEGIRSITTASYDSLSQVFVTCSPLGSKSDVDRLVFYVKGAFATLAMLDYPYANTFVTNMPADPVGVACALMNGSSASVAHAHSSSTTTATTLERLNAAMNVFVNYTGQLQCHNVSMEMVGATLNPMRASNALLKHHRFGRGGSPAVNDQVQMPNVSIYDTWNYQACTELILEPLTSDGNGFYVETEAQVRDRHASCLCMLYVCTTAGSLAVPVYPVPARASSCLLDFFSFFLLSLFQCYRHCADQIPEVEAACKQRYPGVVTRARWAIQAFGTGADVVQHSTNIVFSDGDKDPWSVGGIPFDAVSPDGELPRAHARTHA